MLRRAQSLVFVMSVFVAAAAAAPAARADDLDRIKEAGVLRWGCDAQGGAPYVYLDPDDFDTYIGFEVEIADAIAAELGVKAERTQNQWDLLLPGLARGDCDIAMNGLEITPEHQALALFSRPYYVCSLDIAVPKGTTVAATLGALRKKRVGALKGSFAYRLLKDAGGIDVSGYEGQVEPYADLRFGRIDAVVMDTPIARFCGRADEFSAATADFGEAQYGIAARLGEKRLVTAIDEAIGKLAASGKLREIYDRYGIWNSATAELFGDPGPARARPVMLEAFAKSGEPLTLVQRARRYAKMLKPLGKAAVMTLALSITGMALAVALGLVLALVRVYGASPFRELATIYIEGIRGTPLLIQLYIIFYALPEAGLNLPKFMAAVLGLGLNYAAYEAENYRAGLTSIAIGQTEAAHALGLTHLQTLRFVIVPQALRLVIPPVTNDFIALLKDSSIVSVISMVELTLKYNELANASGDRIGVGMLAAALYFLLGWPFARLAANLEARARRGRR